MKNYNIFLFPEMILLKINWQRNFLLHKLQWKQPGFQASKKSIYISLINFRDDI